MSKFIKFVSLLTLIAMLFTLAACGSSNEGNQTTAPANGGEQTESNDEVTEEQVTIQIYSTLITEKEAPLEQAMADAYMAANKNVKIEFVGTPVNEIAKKIIALNTSGDLPDAFFMPSEFMAQSQDMGIIVDHNDLLGQDYLDSLIPYVVDHSTINDQLMFVPWHVIPVAVLYRTDWLAEEGLDEPQTWDDFLEVAKAFTKDTDNDGQTDRWGFSMVGTRNGSGAARFRAYALSYGVDEVFDNNGTWETDLYSDDYKRALQFYADLALTEGVVPPGATETGYPEAAAFFAQEKTGLMITGSNAIGAIESDNPDLKGKIGSFIIPMDQRHVTVLQPSGYAITTASKHPEIVADYLKFMNSDDIAVNFGTNTGRLPVLQTAATNEAFATETYKGFIDSFEYAIKTPAFPEHTEIFDIMAESYSLMIGNNASVEEAMEQVKSRIEPLLAQNN